MIKLKNILNENNINNIKSGLYNLLNTTHLVFNDIKQNMNEYIKNFDNKKFKFKFGLIDSILGSGVFGVVFKLSNNKVLKLSFDYKEAPFLYKYCLIQKTDGFVNIDKIYEDSYGNVKIFYILRDNLEMISDYLLVNNVINDFKKNIKKNYTNSIQQGVANSINAMLNIDPNWRITHSENFALQKGNVVLYDGFSKNIIPNVSIPRY